MDVDTGYNPPVSSRPYTLPLKYYEWVKEEIESLERVGIIAKSMSPLGKLNSCPKQVISWGTPEEKVMH